MGNGNGLDRAIQLDARLGLASFRMQGKEIEGLSTSRSIGPFPWDPEQLVLYLNGTAVGKGKLVFETDGPVFEVAEVAMEENL
jgi:hypothetical protein